MDLTWAAFLWTRDDKTNGSRSMGIPVCNTRFYFIKRVELIGPLNRKRWFTRHCQGIKIVMNSCIRVKMVKLPSGKWLRSNNVKNVIV